MRNEMKGRWTPISDCARLRRQQRRRRCAPHRLKRAVLIGTALCLLILLLCGCARTEYVYVEAPREPITCHRHMKTFLDMAKCLEEYKAKY